MASKIILVAFAALCCAQGMTADSSVLADDTDMLLLSNLITSLQTTDRSGKPENRISPSYCGFAALAGLRTVQAGKKALGEYRAIQDDLKKTVAACQGSELGPDAVACITKAQEHADKALHDLKVHRIPSVLISTVSTVFFIVNCVL